MKIDPMTFRGAFCFYVGQFCRLPAFRSLLWIRDVVTNFRIYKRKNIRVSAGCKIRKTFFEGHNFVSTNTQLSNVSMGLFSYVAHSSSIAEASIGRFCSIGMETLIGPGRHPTHFISTHPFFFSPSNEANNFCKYDARFEERKKIVIGNDVWIGAHAIIMDGILVGDGVIIAAGAIVTRDIPSLCNCRRCTR